MKPTRNADHLSLRHAIKRKIDALKAEAERLPVATLKSFSAHHWRIVMTRLSCC